MSAPPAPADPHRYAELFACIAVVEVAGRMQPSALSDIVGELIAR